MMSVCSRLRSLCNFPIQRQFVIFSRLTCSSSSISSSTPPRGKPKFGSFHNVGDAIASFDLMLRSNPLPSTRDFTRLLSDLVKMKQYQTVISLSRRMELFGISHNIYSISVLINSFCRLNRVVFGYSLVGKIIKLGFEPDIITLTTLLTGSVKKINLFKPWNYLMILLQKGTNLILLPIL